MGGGRVVVVTGASSGVGRAAARAFAREGARLALLARGRDGLEAAAREVETLGGRALVLPLDVADADAVERAATTTEERLGAIDVWVNSAMLSVFSPVAQLRPDEVRRVTEVTYLGAVYGTLAALARMRERDRGTIVQVGSALAYRGIPLQAAYSGAKHALQGFCDSLRSELLHDGSGVQLTTVHLPALNTPQFDVVRSRLPRHPRPVPPIFQPELAADAIVWASRHPRRELYVGWPTVKGIAGDKLVPGVADRYLAATGWRSQQTSDPVEADRPDNLWTPLPGDRGAHGSFDDEARSRSLQLWASTHRGALLGTLVGAAALAALVSRGA